MELRYSELKFDGIVYTEQWKIDEILIKNKFNWLVSSEIKNARLEIFEGTLVWNGGIWYNGNWYFGVWRDGEWRYGTWENGVFYNGVWRNGTFKSGIIFNGKFFKGKIEGGEIRGGQFIDVEIDPKVIEFTGDETQAKQAQAQTQAQPQVAQAQPQPNPDKVVFHSTQSTEPFTTQPKIQQEKITYDMKNIKKFNEYKKINKWKKSKYGNPINHGSIGIKYTGDIEDFDEEDIESNIQYEHDDLLKDANYILNKYSNTKVVDIDGAIVGLEDLKNDKNLDFDIIDYIDELLSKLNILNGDLSESVGELEDSFVDINIDQTELEVTDKKSGKLQQKVGIEIIENPSKTDEYNAKMRKGGETVASKDSEKTLHFVKKFNDLK